MIILLSWACKPAPSIVEIDVPPPQLSIEEVETKVRNSLAQGIPSILSVQEQYVQSMQLSDGLCPEFTQTNDRLHGNWNGECTTNDGTDFYGFATYFEQGFEQQGSLYANALTASFEISNQQQSFIVGGVALINLQQFPKALEMRLDGTFQVEPSDSWMQNGSISLSINGDLDGSNINLVGGVQYPEINLSFDNVYPAKECNGLPQGNLDIRDPSGYWFTYQATDCALCGPLLWRGYPYGEICLVEELDGAIDTYINELLTIYSD